MPENDTDLLKEVRDEFKYYQSEWRDTFDEGNTDMRYNSGDPWEPREKQLRKDANRPALSSDELSQYVNQLVNDPRQNPRAIKINPEGDGATDKTAQAWENIIRNIQYDSKAQSAFTTGFQGAAERSYGYWRVGARYKGDSFDQELYIGRIPNPNTVMFHPLFTEVDASDAMGCFVTDRMRVEDFTRKYQNAELTDFTPELAATAPGWLDAKEIMVAEYWKVAIERKTLHLIEQDGAPLILTDEEIKGTDQKRIKRSRTVEKRKITQYITNGVEILEKTAIPIEWIPIIPVFGKELYIEEGGKAKRILQSLIRLAREPFMMYCYLISQEAEEAGMSPKTPIMGYTGQFQTDLERWKMLNKIPTPFIQVDPVVDSATNQVLPLPQWKQFTPNFQAYEMAIEGARRRIQAAMGVSSLPTAAQRLNEKSGTALEKIKSQEERGSFHFIDNYNHAIEHTGRICVAWGKVIYDTSRDVAGRKPDESSTILRINDPENKVPAPNGGEMVEHLDMTSGEHGVTVSTGPSFESQRAEASDLIQSLIQNIKSLPLAPPQAAKMLSLAIRMKNIGPLGDEMADIISPPDDAQQQQQQFAQAQQQLQAAQQAMQEMQQELQKLQLEKAGKMIQGETQKQLAQMQNDIKVLVALIEAKTQNTAQEQEMYKTFWLENHGAAHEAGMQAQQQQHEKDQAASAQAAMAAQSEQAPTGGGASSPGGGAQ